MTENPEKLGMSAATTMALPRGNGSERLNVTDNGGSFTLTVSGGGNITPREYDKIAVFVSGRDGAETFLAKLTARMGR